MPSKKSIRTTILIGVIVSAIIAIPGILLMVFGHLEGIILLGAGAGGLAFLPSMVKGEKAKQAIMASRYAHFTDDDFLNLENELYTSKIMYNTFYMLNEYLFVPGEGLLLAYTDIHTIRTIRHTKNTIPNGATIVFCCGNVEFPVRIGNWKSYLNQISLFERMLNEKKDGRQVKVEWKRENSIEIPYIHLG